MSVHTVITESGQLRDVDTGDRADGHTWVWDETAQAHVYVPLPEGGDGSDITSIDGGTL